MLKKVFETALVGVIAIGLLAMIEVGLRLIFPARTILPSGSATIEPDPQLIYALKPGIRAEFRRSDVNGGQTIIWSTNAEGYRGNPLRAKHDLRVEVFGDSNIQGIFSDLANTFVARLESYLSGATGKDVEVVNAGVVGYGPDQNLLRLSHDVVALQPDVVVFHVFADNDYGDLLRNRLFRQSGGALERHPAPFEYPRRSLFARLQQFAASLLVVRAARKLTGLTSSERSGPGVGHGPPTDPDQYVAQLLLRSEDELQAYNDGTWDSMQVDHYDLDVALHPEGQSARTKIDLMAAVIGAARNVADRAGVKFLVLIEPSPVDLTTNLSLDYRYLARFPKYRPERLTEILQEICAERSIAYVDLFPVFKAASPDQLYFRDTDNHWNDAGQDLAAHEVAGAVVRLIGAGPR